MPPPKPEPGLVISYEFLWEHEAQGGLEYGQKPRPCAIIVALVTQEGKTEVVVAPITHTSPTPPTVGIEIPAKVKARLGLDAQPSWVIATDLNVFTWPGFDLAPIPGCDPPRYDYGVLPPKLFERIKKRILAIDAELKSATKRD